MVVCERITATLTGGGDGSANAELARQADIVNATVVSSARTASGNEQRPNLVSEASIAFS
jgi:hypothetical protein